MTLYRQLLVAMLVVACGLLLLPAKGFAQQSGIAGVVRDTSGGALPGVTVEAASPALIEGPAPSSPTARACIPSSTCGPAPTS